jgi:hypothetical protein
VTIEATLQRFSCEDYNSTHFILDPCDED